jgi:3-oxoacyl-[acyl-carrier protein] reductase
MDLGIRGRKALVNGGSSGLGKASALALAREGVELFISARSEPRLSLAAAEIASATGAAVIPIQADHSTAEGREKILALCPDPDILVVTCSPPEVTEDFRAIDEASWLLALQATMISPIEFIRATVDGMAARGFGRIVNIATGAAKNPHVIRLLSGAPRAALVNYTVAVAKQFARHNVAINNLLPGMYPTDTMMKRFGAMAAANGRSVDDEIGDFVDRWRIPAGRFGDPEEFGAICAFLCSSHARNVIGQSLLVDGGIMNSTF